MKSVVLELIDEQGQSLMKLPLEEYAISLPGEETSDEQDNQTIVAHAEQLIGSVLKRIEEAKAQPLETPTCVRISISETLLLGAETEGTELTIAVKVRARDANRND